MFDLPLNFTLRGYVTFLFVLFIWFYNEKLMKIITPIDRVVPQYLYITSLVLFIVLIILFVSGFIIRLKMKKQLSSAQKIFSVKKDVITVGDVLKYETKLYDLSFIPGFVTKVLIFLYNYYNHDFVYLITNRKVIFNESFNVTQSGKYLIGIEDIFVEDIFGLIRFRLDYSKYNEILCLPEDNSEQLENLLHFPDTLVASSYDSDVYLDSYLSVREHQPYDDKRMINWKISAKKNRLYVRFSEPEDYLANQAFLFLSTSLFTKRLSRTSNYYTYIVYNLLIEELYNIITYSLNNNIEILLSINMDDVLKVSSEADLQNIVSKLYDFDFSCEDVQTRLLSITEHKSIPIIFLCTSIDNRIGSFFEEYQRLIDVPLIYRSVSFSDTMKDFKDIVEKENDSYLDSKWNNFKNIRKSLLAARNTKIVRMNELLESERANKEIIENYL